MSIFSNFQIFQIPAQEKPTVYRNTVEPFQPFIFVDQSLLVLRRIDQSKYLLMPTWHEFVRRSFVRLSVLKMSPYSFDSRWL